MLITMRLNPKRMVVVIQTLAAGDVDQLTLQSSILIRLLQYKDEVERVRIWREFHCRII